MKAWLIGTVVLAIVVASLPDIADAKRLGGSRSSGMQRSMPERTAPPPATPVQPGNAAGNAATPAQAVPGAAAAAPAAAGAAAAAGKRSWLGPIAGLAAGLGLVALMSHLGMGAAFANFLMLALLAVAAVALIAFVMRRMNAGKLAAAGAGTGPGSGIQRAGGQPQAWSPMQRASSPEAASVQPVAWPAAPVDGATVPGTEPATAADTSNTAANTAATAIPAAPRVFVPAAFDSEGFSRVAKAIFIRLQAANDASDLDDLRRFTTPEMFAELRLDLQDRAGSAQHTDVVKVDAEVLDVATEDDRQVISVRYRGQIAEVAGATPEDFDEVWHLVKPQGDGGSWAIAGIEQMQVR